MDQKGRPQVVPLVLFFLFLQVIAPGVAVPCGAQTPPAGGEPGMLITEVLPAARGGNIETEYVTLKNNGGTATDISGWKVCDEHNCVTFGNSSGLTNISPGASITIAQNATVFKIMMYGTTADFGYIGVEPGQGTWNFTTGSVWPAMVNEGDFIWLEDKEGIKVDVVAFGRDYQGQGWTGPPAGEPRMSWTMVRDHRIVGDSVKYLDTNTSVDWPVYRTRRAQFRPIQQYSGEGPLEVTALRFPQDGGVLAGIIQNATKSVDINTYEFTSIAMEEILETLPKKGVTVRILLEGHPVGGLKDNAAQIIWNLNSSMCQVRLVWTQSATEGAGPFGLDHAKYMLIDGTTTVIMSENLVGSALGTASGSANRGWGLAVKDLGLAGHYQQLFAKDWLVGKDFEEVIGKGPGPGYNVTKWAPLIPKEPAKGTMFSGYAQVTALVTPDDTEDLLLGLIMSSTKRVYVEMLSCDLDWHLQSGYAEKQKSPLLEALIGAARRGVEVRVLLDSAYLDSSDNAQAVSYMNEVANRENLTMAARLADIPNITVVHNKGMIVDQMVLVSSINWVDSAVRDNREVGVAVTLEGLDDLYVKYFMEDWEVQPQVPTDGPGPDTPAAGSIYPICGGLLAFSAIGLLLFAMMRRTRR